ncbi:toll/interleukin-1 receptor domain-containing protein [Caballeronia choica]|uniref:toll/interleukin-1 receptor domain-containing protein n=1 Tax=Caballeronia choica TaxID=326476 RepID=UPI001F455811|nr:toll/interleukin-1 receptor domain-containing protein [Caballeronia choica]
MFISYGGCDELIARQINESLKSRGIKTWFFPDDSVPGEKLHRVMHVGVNSYDRVLLVCSRTSLGRSGVLNELERVLEREAREGGGDILLPITIDDFVFSDWKPQNEDVATQVRSRVICRIPDPGTDSIIFEKTMDRLEAMSLYTTSLSRHDSEKARLLSMT